MSDSENAACERFDLLLEPFVDGELDASEAHALEGHLQSCARCSAELEVVRAVRHELRGLPRLECPPEVAQQALDVARAEGSAGAGAMPANESDGGMTLWLRAAAALVLLSGGLVAGALLFGDREDLATQATAEYTAAELAQAEEELRFALGYFGSIARRAGTTLRNDVLAERVFEPPRRAFRRLGAMQQASEGTTATNGAPSEAREENP